MIELKSHPGNITKGSVQADRKLLENNQQLSKTHLDKVFKLDTIDINPPVRLANPIAIVSSEQILDRDIYKYQQLFQPNLENKVNKKTIDPPVVADTKTPVPVVSVSQRISAQELHKYVAGLIGIFAVFSITYPLAMVRVSHKPKFAPYQSHLKSLPREAQSIDLK
jgi:hypothetical protein